MKVTEKDVAYVADLANLELTDQERQRMLKDLNSILDYIDRLNELDTSDVPPLAQISAGFGQLDAGNAGRLSTGREDTLVPGLPHAEAMKNAPGTDGEFFKVPRVIEK
ncbi:MAG TPA: Asp-tRNA(Asn)/Glu-tRNA(Gln) amidotransferase subunit GatC [Candidatus Binatia bacterium]|nr:Asp-tRNA(Asn)/Glu-tRNA(Gln) amidotransferase subunit GatC [Candidatus Binatia bacterium]